jgi:alkanesulfonate monooxygenase SsuD/methylene tetrahydromethanopterin reductase-like flavin-dependent oxidoreductase (luciferase family)
MFTSKAPADTMETNRKLNLGIMFRREHSPEALPAFARRAEEAGFDELWVVEDCFYGSGIASAAVALACTKTIRVGLGIMPAVVRNPVFTAMEIATLARLYPGRFLPGIGHGVTAWMKQIGAFPSSQLRALEEVTATVRRILTGEKVSFEGTEVNLAEAQLVHPPQEVPPISLGVRGPKSLALSGRVADGTILAEYAAPAYLAWAREQIARGQRDAGRTDSHRLTVFNFTCVQAQSASARWQLRPLVASAMAAGKIDAHIAPMGILPAVKEMMADGGRARLEEEMPDDWVEQLSISGTPEECVGAIGRLVDAGANTVVLIPLPDKDLHELERFASRLLPSL